MEGQYKEVQGEAESIAAEIAGLQGQLSKLGLFAGKEKKELNSQISSNMLKKKSAIEKAQELSNRIGELPEKRILQDELSLLEEKIEIKQNSTGFSASLDSILDEIKEKIAPLGYTGPSKRKEIMDFMKEHCPETANDYVLSFPKVGELVEVGVYLQDASDVSPIKWQILKIEDNRILLLSDKAIDCKPFDENTTSAPGWNDSSIKKWLNTSFYKVAFTEDEQSIIGKQEESNETLEKVFLLSVDEVQECLADIKNRVCKPTSFALRSGGKESSDSISWWLRTKGVSAIKTACVLNNGEVDNKGFQSTFKLGIRPAIWVTFE